MSPSEIIYFLLIGAVVLAVIGFMLVIFRRRKIWVIAFGSILVVGYVGSYVFYPSLKVNTHQERYNQVIDYLVENYPDKEFTILPEHYEEGYRVGEFQVNDIETPKFGVTLRVGKDGQVKQIGTWSNQEYPTQQNLWKELVFIYGETYTFNKELAEIIKEDEWIEGELTAFALKIDTMPAIALFNYSSGGYGLLELKKGESEGFVSVEEEEYVFVYIDEHYQEELVTIQLENGKEYTFNVDQQRGRLIVKTIRDL